MIRKLFNRPPKRAEPKHVVAYLGDLPLPWGDKHAALRAIVARWDAYEARQVDMTIAPCEDMFAADDEGAAHYRAVGLSALELISDALILAGKTEIGRILDLPCGGGRVTRHLAAFFPGAELFVSDIDKTKQAAVMAQFAATAFEVASDFSERPDGQFDLIFVGSLVTHFNQDLFERTIGYLVDALAPGGVLVVTTHGRYSVMAARYNETRAGRTQPPEPDPKGKDRDEAPAVIVDNVLWAIDSTLQTTGFAYSEAPGCTSLYGQSYGGSYTTPSWVMRLIEPREDVLILGFKERGYAANQDALMLQKF